MFMRECLGINLTPHNKTSCTCITTRRRVLVLQQDVVYLYYNKTSCTCNTTRRRVPVLQQDVVYLYHNKTSCTCITTRRRVLVGRPPIRLPGKQETGVLEYYSARMGECDVPALATFDLLVDSCAMACAENDRCVGFRHLNSSVEWDRPLGLCVLQSETCLQTNPKFGAMTYTKGKGNDSFPIEIEMCYFKCEVGFGLSRQNTTWRRCSFLFETMVSL